MASQSVAVLSPNMEDYLKYLRARKNVTNVSYELRENGSIKFIMTYTKKREVEGGDVTFTSSISKPCPGTQVCVRTNSSHNSNNNRRLHTKKNTQANALYEAKFEAKQVKTQARIKTSDYKKQQRRALVKQGQITAHGVAREKFLEASRKKRAIRLKDMGLSENMVPRYNAPGVYMSKKHKAMANPIIDEMVRKMVSGEQDT